MALSPATSRGSVAFSGVRCTQSANQSIPSATETAVVWDAEEYDTDGYHTTGGSNTRVTIPAGLGGYFLLAAVVRTGGLPAGQFLYAYFKKNGTTTLVTLGSSALQGNTGVATVSPCTSVVSLAAADYVEVIFFQSDSSAHNTVASSCAFSVARLGS